MKLRVTLLFVLPLLLCAGHFISAREARGASQALLGQAQAARAAMDAEDWASAQTQAQQLRAGWDEAHARLQLWIDHAQLDEVSRALAGVEASVQARARAQGLMQAALLEEALRSLPERNAPALGNVL